MREKGKEKETEITRRERKIGKGQRKRSGMRGKKDGR